MQKHLFRVAADVPNDVRRTLLAQFPPRHGEVFVQTVTLAYRVTGEFEFPRGEREFVVYAYHAGDGHDALLVKVDGDNYRPDGKKFHITLSTNYLPPVIAGDIKDRDIVLVERVRFTATFKAFPLWNSPAKGAMAA